MIISLIILLSFGYTKISDRYKIPSVILLIFTGYAIKRLLLLMEIIIPIPFDMVQILGSIGLVLIVLEGSLDLKINKKNFRIIRHSFSIALFLLVLSSISIGAIIHYVMKTPFINGIVYAIPLSIISSAIVIPSITNLPAEKKEFMTYEATFSDILGILLFNMLLYANITKATDIISYSAVFIFVIIFSIIISGLLVYFIGIIEEKYKTIVVLAALILLYSAGKLMHISSLILILFFGLFLNNLQELLKYIKLKHHFNVRNINKATVEFKKISSEYSFIVRTIFFVVFGYTINLNILADKYVILLGIVIILIIYFFRIINIRLIMKTHLFPEVLIAPRGLITILLFYSIPDKYIVSNFKEGILLIVILMTSLIMALGLYISPDKEKTAVNNK